MIKPEIYIHIQSGRLEGKQIIESVKYIGDMKGVYLDEKFRSQMDPEIMTYRVQAWMPVEEGKAGGLFFGNSTIYPGKVGKEYFMTRGHYHENRDTAEYYWCIKGNGCLLIMDATREVRAEQMNAGSLHYIPGNCAHRVVNTGVVPLTFNACWPSDAGHNYAEIDKKGFSLRLLEEDGNPRLMGTI